MAIRKMFSSMLGAGLLVIVLGGCEREGPMERAGEKVDEAVEDLSKATKKEGAMEQAGKKLDKAAEEASDKMKEATEPGH
jgi:hypothetical protein